MVSIETDVICSIKTNKERVTLHYRREKRVHISKLVSSLLIISGIQLLFVSKEEIILSDFSPAVEAHFATHAVYMVLTTQGKISEECTCCEI